MKSIGFVESRVYAHIFASAGQPGFLPRREYKFKPLAYRYTMGRFVPFKIRHNAFPVGAPPLTLLGNSRFPDHPVGWEWNTPPRSTPHSAPLTSQSGGEAFPKKYICLEASVCSRPLGYILVPHFPTYRCHTST